MSEFISRGWTDITDDEQHLLNRTHSSLPRQHSDDAARCNELACPSAEPRRVLS